MLPITVSRAGPNTTSIHFVLTGFVAPASRPQHTARPPEGQNAPPSRGCPFGLFPRAQATRYITDVGREIVGAVLLILMRHGEAGEADSRRWPDDRHRPLTDAGRHEHARVAEALRRMGMRFDRLLSSPLVRSRETAEITARAYDAAAPELTELLGDEAEPASSLAGLAAVEASALLCVGHEPTLSRLAGLLTSRDGSGRVEMAKSGVRVIECPGATAPGRGALRMHLRAAQVTPLLDAGATAAADPS